jgi:hypothetical protein
MGGWNAQDRSRTVAKLGAMRRQDESYSDASLALAEAHAGR